MARGRDDERIAGCLQAWGDQTGDEVFERAAAKFRARADAEEESGRPVVTTGGEDRPPSTRRETVGARRRG